MSIHQCPKCELKFAYRTELDYHCRDEHPTFVHQYHVTRQKDGAMPDR